MSGTDSLPLSRAMPAPAPLSVVAPDVTLFVIVFEFDATKTPASVFPSTPVPAAFVPT